MLPLQVSRYKGWICFPLLVRHSLSTSSAERLLIISIKIKQDNERKGKITPASGASRSDSQLPHTEMTFIWNSPSQAFFSPCSKECGRARAPHRHRGPGRGAPGARMLGGRCSRAGRCRRAGRYRRAHPTLPRSSHLAASPPPPPLPPPPAPSWPPPAARPRRAHLRPAGGRGGSRTAPGGRGRPRGAGAAPRGLARGPVAAASALRPQRRCRRRRQTLTGTRPREGAVPAHCACAFSTHRAPAVRAGTRPQRRERAGGSRWEWKGRGKEGGKAGESAAKTELP